ncbi:zinc-binding alcohol dehydrogenase family protein [Protaetiibacter intestinalis]|uniref:Zinc-type alcohol dehydrogenase-like protein n=2 Tax=Protaetiibacter intestinalis TaxID=2419774 RepID=A0A387BCI4_9MICO|nr:zinc-binding alcohol dehydrogenase family protein [Protaetiibacter intestinalis]
MWAVGARGSVEVEQQDAFEDVVVAVPDLRERDVLVRVEAVSINPVDTKTRLSTPADQRRILGWDASGVVEAVGSGVERFRLGDEVWYAGDITRDGCDSEFHAVDERLVAKKPRTLSHASAAALPLTALTAWESLFERLQIDGGSSGTLLVMAGAGGVGSIMLQLAKRLTGVRVVATASREDSREWAVHMGADAVVNHHDLAASVSQLAPEGVDWVFSSHTRGNEAAYAEILKPFGAVVAVDGADGLDLAPFKSKSVAFHWEYMFTRARYQTSDMGRQGEILAEVARLVDSGSVRSTMRTNLRGFSAENLRKAHRMIESGRTIGKVTVAR